MKSLYKIDLDEWRETANPVDLFEFQSDPHTIHSQLGFEFFEYVEDGLGPASGLFLEVGRTQCFLRHLDSEQGNILCKMLSNENAPSVILGTLIEELELTKKKITWVRNPLCSPQWEIWITKDDQKVLVSTYHEKHDAEFISRKLIDTEIRFRKASSLYDIDEMLS